MSYLKLFAVKDDSPYVIISRAVKIAQVLGCTVEVNYTTAIKVLVDEWSDLYSITEQIRTRLQAAEPIKGPVECDSLAYTGEAITLFERIVEQYKVALSKAARSEAGSVGHRDIEPVDVYHASMIIAESSPTYIPHEKFKVPEDKTHKLVPTTDWPLESDFM